MKCGRNAENAERYQKEGLGLGFNLCVTPLPRNQVVPDFGWCRKEKEWNEGVQKDYQIPV